MSSSKIIKQSEPDSSSVSEFTFRPVGTGGNAVSGQVAGGFIPLALFQGAEQNEHPDDAAESGPPPIEISEEELKQKLSDAFNEGIKEGRELAERGLVNVFRALRSAGEALHDMRDKVLRESEDELIKLIMHVARKVIIREISQDRSILAGVVQNAIAGLSAREEMTIHLHPDDYLLVTSGRDEQLRNELVNDRLRLKPDPNVAVGMCLVDTEMGTVDANLDSQLEHIYRSLLDQRSAESQQNPVQTDHA